MNGTTPPFPPHALMDSMWTAVAQANTGASLLVMTTNIWPHQRGDFLSLELEPPSEVLRNQIRQVR